jgi:hypothetical protein
VIYDSRLRGKGERDESEGRTVLRESGRRSGDEGRATGESGGANQESRRG